jgi:hypothetical protein
MFKIKELRSIQKQYYTYVQSRSDPARSSCPAPEILSSLVNDRLSLEEKSNTMHHAMSCVFCLQEIKIILKSTKMEKTVRKEYLLARLFRRFKFTYRAQTKIISSLVNKKNWAAFSSAILIFTIIFTTTFFIKDKVLFQGPTRGTANIFIKTSSPKKHTSISISSLEFHWEEIEKSDHYFIEIFNSDLKRIWKSDKIKKNIYIPHQELKLILNRKGKYYWMVTAKLISGISIESTLSDFHMK